MGTHLRAAIGVYGQDMSYEKALQEMIQRELETHLRPLQKSLTQLEQRYEALQVLREVTRGLAPLLGQKGREVALRQVQAPAAPVAPQRAPSVVAAPKAPAAVAAPKAAAAMDAAARADQPKRAAALDRELAQGLGPDGLTCIGDAPRPCPDGQALVTPKGLAVHLARNGSIVLAPRDDQRQVAQVVAVVLDQRSKAYNTAS